MKKTISYLALALVMLGNVTMASNNEIISETTSINEVFDATPLCVAISKGDFSLVKKIIDYGADVNETTNRGMTPLMFAARYGHVEIVNLLLDKGAKLDKKDSSGFTALDHAKSSHSDNIVTILKEAEKK
ncbi:ankyrin repeat domain-containing protein [Flavobacterium chuncheonense]|uniref:Ankyrin repeat domain-containing protein n=1 Tax=Flavobacterium chuncheonense TaxID=2026653 RepID=A0ABW5YJT5_9FLAO